MTTQELLLTAWEPGVLVPMVCLAALASYGAYVRARPTRRSLFFALAVLLFFLALASPIGVLARGYLFSAHMVQHLILMLAVPPLILLGLPRRDDASSSTQTRGVHGLLGPWFCGVGAMWIWHARTLCNAAAVSPVVQGVQTVSLVVMGLAFWRPILAPRLSDRAPVFSAMGYLFTACVACTVLGIVVTLSPVEVCTAYVHPVDSLGALPLLRDGWGLSMKADQEIGGLLMWVPTCLVYGAAILATLARYYAGERVAPQAQEAE
jgi:putative membrane protein